MKEAAAMRNNIYKIILFMDNSGQEIKDFYRDMEILENDRTLESRTVEY